MKKAFTMTELLVIVAIIAVLAALLVPTLTSAKEKAHLSVCGSHLNSIGKAAILYQNDYDGCLPIRNPREGLLYGGQGTTPQILPDPLRRYGMGLESYQCSAGPARQTEPAKQLSDYIVRFTIDFSELNGNRSLSYRIDPNPSTVLAWDWNHTGGNLLATGTKWTYLRADGSVATVATEALKKSFLKSDGSWREDDPLAQGTYQFVFPGETWPPGFHRISE
jgi:hypothetical protein